MWRCVVRRFATKPPRKGSGKIESDIINVRPTQLAANHRSHVTRLLWEHRDAPLNQGSECADESVPQSLRQYGVHLSTRPTTHPDSEEDSSTGMIRGGDSSLPARRPLDSHCEAHLPFRTDLQLRDSYVNFWGRLRFGKIMEDLDALAGTIAYRHCRDPKLVIVTASVDRIDLLAQLQQDIDVKLSGHVTFVGKSSMEVLIRIETDTLLEDEADGPHAGLLKKSSSPKKNASSQWHLLATARFTMVARSRETNQAVGVPPLRLVSLEDQAMFEEGATNREYKKREEDHALTKQPPTAEEALYMHQLFLETQSIDSSNTSPERIYRWPEETRRASLHLCHPQDRNIHGFVFGGYLMRQAFELAYATATEYARSAATFIALDALAFRRPVPIGSILSLAAKVVYAEGAPHRTFQVEIVAEVCDPERGIRETSNIFHFTFASKAKNAPPVPRLLPRTYADAVACVTGRRRKMRGLAATRAHALAREREEAINRE